MDRLGHFKSEIMSRKELILHPLKMKATRPSGGLARGLRAHLANARLPFGRRGQAAEQFGAEMHGGAPTGRLGLGAGRVFHGAVVGLPAQGAAARIDG
jgi:hypothetical protein